MNARIISEYIGPYDQRNLKALVDEPKLYPPLTWVADFIYRPLFFAGVGLSQDELGMWWLLNQRQRNFARLSHDHVPPVYVLVHASDPRMSFWQSRPFGIEPVVCEHWDESNCQMLCFQGF